MRNTIKKTGTAAMDLTYIQRRSFPQYRSQPLQQQYTGPGAGQGNDGGKDGGDGGKDGGAGGGNDGGKDGGPGKEGESQEVKDAKKAAADAKKAQQAAEKKAAEAEKLLDEERSKTLSEDQRNVAAERKKAVEDAVGAKEVELTDHYETQLSAYRGEIIDGIIEAGLAKAGRDPKDFATILSALDKKKFLDDDGGVKKDEVRKWAAELAGSGSGSTSGRPPRTGSTRTSETENLGFGRYLSQKQNT